MIDEIHDEISRKADATSLSLSTHSVSRPQNEDQLSKIADSGVSSIEKSKAVKQEVIPPINSPILNVPTGQESMAFAVASIDAFGQPVLETVHSFILQGEEIKHSILQNWMKNLKEIEEVVRQLLSSPLYRQLQDIRSTGDLQSSHVSGIQGIISAIDGKDAAGMIKR